MVESNNRRQFFRIDGDFPIEIHVKEEDGSVRKISAISQNLSASGLLITCPERLETGSHITLLINFPEDNFNKIRSVCRSKYHLHIDSDNSAIKLTATIIREQTKAPDYVYALEFLDTDRKTLSFLIRFVIEEAVRMAE